jgi:hypothetical protein
MASMHLAIHERQIASKKNPAIQDRQIVSNHLAIKECQVASDSQASLFWRE